MRKRIQQIADEKVHLIREWTKLKIATEELEKIKEEIENEVAVQGSKNQKV